MTQDWRRRFDEPPEPEYVTNSWLEAHGTTDQLLERINTAVEARDDLHDAVPMMVRFFELMLEGAPVPKLWQERK